MNTTEYDDDITITSDLFHETCFSVKFSVSKSIADYWVEGDWDIPEEYDQIFLNGRIGSEDDGDDEDYQRFLNLLRRDDRKWKDVVFEEDACNESPLPDLLATLNACIGKVDRVHFWGDVNDMDLINCINAGLAMKNGIKGVYIADFQKLTNEQVRLFGRGLHLAENLEYLALDLEEYEHDTEEAPIHAEVLIQGLQSSTTLREMELVSWIFPEDTLSQLVATLQSCPSLRELDMRNVDLSSARDQESLRRWLASENCQLECLKMYHGDNGHNTPDPDANIDFGNLDRGNTSLKHLRLGAMDIKSSSLPPVFASYRNLISLDLRENTISDLEPFDSLLLSENCILESLMLSGNPITVDSIRSFAQKLPRMKMLRNLELSISNDDHEALNVLADAAVQNTSLERFHVISDKCDPYEYEPLADWFLDHDDDDDESSVLRVEAFLLSTLESDLINKLNHTLCLNRAGRRHVGCNPSSLPLHLLPIAVSRASTSRYHKVNGEEREDEWGYYPSSRSGILDATFWLLRENCAFVSRRVLMHSQKC